MSSSSARTVPCHRRDRCDRPPPRPRSARTGSARPRVRPRPGQGDRDARAGRRPAVGDFDDAGWLRAAMDGIDQVFLACSNDPHAGVVGDGGDRRGR